MASFSYYDRNFYNCACVHYTLLISDIRKNIRSNEINQLTQTYSRVTNFYNL